MAIAYLNPIAVGTYNSWTLASGANRWDAVALPDDDATTRMSNTGGSSRQAYYVEALLGAESINSVKVYIRHRLTTHYSPGSSEGIGVGIRLGTSEDDKTPHTATNTWSWRTDTTAGFNRPGGGSWTGADFPGGGAGAQIYARFPLSGTASVLEMTTLVFEVDYVPQAGGGGFAFGVASILGALGANILLREMPLLRAELWRRRRLLLSREEVLKTWQELRSHRYPKHFDMRLKAT